MSQPRTVWEALDPAGPPRMVWLRPPSPPPRALLLPGAFDPPTLAHVALAEGASRRTGLPAAFCLTKVLLDRPGPPLLPPWRRLELLAELGAERGLGLVVANRGTYLELHRGALASGCRATFLVGSDKLRQIRDPRFYPDGPSGVRATLAEVEFLVVARGGGEPEEGLPVLQPEEVFPDPGLARISATEVRRRLAAGEPFGELVPEVVAVALAGYTRRR